MADNRPPCPSCGLADQVFWYTDSYVYPRRYYEDGNRSARGAWFCERCNGWLSYLPPVAPSNPAG